MFDAAEAQLIGLFLESLLFGALSVFSLISVWILSRREPNRTGLSFLNKWMIGISLAMLLLAATHVGLTVQRVLKGFSYESRDEVDDFFHTDATPPYVVQTILLTILTMIGDGFMAYRVSVLWNRSPFPVGLSFLLVCGTTFSGLRTAYELAKSPGSPSTLAPTALVQTSAFIGLSLVTNLVSTLLLLWRVYGLGRGINKTGSGVFASTVHWRVMRTIVQSEALYSAALIANLAVYLSASPMLEILLDVLPQLVVSTIFTVPYPSVYALTSTGGSAGNIVYVDYLARWTERCKR
ncbi:hypothetical protein BD414DRAFT_478843 [Trametes punicea]|nr:hypothetical protein BD414DRAFT_478843 [Trametes punicea]